MPQKTTRSANANKIIKLNDQGYYKGSSHYTPVPIEQASKLTRPRAESIRRNLRKLGYTTASIHNA